MDNTFEITKDTKDCKYLECSYYEYETGYSEYECTFRTAHNLHSENDDAFCYYQYCPFTCNVNIRD